MEITNDASGVGTVVMIVGLICAAHIGAFVFWVYKYSTTSDKPTMDFKQSKD